MNDWAVPATTPCSGVTVIEAAAAAVTTMPVCVVVSDGRVVLGLLRAAELRGDPELLVDQVMRPGPSTYRPFVPVAELRGIMSDRNLESSPVTTSDGRLVGLVRRQDVGLGSIDP